MRKETSRKILFLLIDGKMEFNEIVHKVEKSSLTIPQNFTELLKNDLIILKIENSKKNILLKITL